MQALFSLEFESFFFLKQKRMDKLTLATEKDGQ